MGGHPHVYAWGIRLGGKKRWGDTRIYSFPRIAYTEIGFMRKENAMNAFDYVTMFFTLRLFLPIGLLLLLGEWVRVRELRRYSER